ncbi:ladderlectin-like [Cololabis saira]|uniref:ladderlectin-like n=1 Tax=Cololabis saira TaxID=129043 RepID=UPI002AD3DFC9|nr:ladderlectin-like [Cololabis saira]
MKILVASLVLCLVIAQTDATRRYCGRRGSWRCAPWWSWRCPPGWSAYKGRCLRYIPKPMTWAQAELNCRSMKGTLASVHNIHEYHKVQQIITAASHGYSTTWIGGSDAQQEKLWLWSDGSSFDYSYWCRGEPNNFHGKQHCLQINYSVKKCWDDVHCGVKLPSVCARKFSLF